MKAAQFDIHANPNTGLFLFVNDKFCLAPKETLEHHREELEKTLQVPIYYVATAGTSLNGIFCVGNNKGLLVPAIINEQELEELQKICEQHDVLLTVFDTELTALGNLIAADDDIAFVSKDFLPHDKNVIKDALKIDNVITLSINKHEIPGSMMLIGPKGILVASSITDDEVEIIKEHSDKAIIGCTAGHTDNLRSAIALNAKGYIVGTQILGDEIMILEEVYHE